MRSGGYELKSKKLKSRTSVAWTALGKDGKLGGNGTAVQSAARSFEVKMSPKECGARSIEDKIKVTPAYSRRDKFGSDAHRT